MERRRYHINSPLAREYHRRRLQLVETVHKNTRRKPQTSYRYNLEAMQLSQSFGTIVIRL